MKSTLDLKAIANLGGSIIVDSSKSTLDLKSIANLLNNGSTLTIKNASNKSTLDLKSIANMKPGQVIFDFT